MPPSFEEADRPRHAAGVSAFDAILQDVIREPLKKTSEHVDVALEEHHAAVHETRREIKDLRKIVEQLARRVESADRAAGERDRWLVTKVDAIQGGQQKYAVDRDATDRALTEMTTGAATLHRLILVLTAIAIVQLVAAGAIAGMILTR